MASLDIKAIIQTEVERDGNGVCAECFSINPTFASLNLGVFICQKCAKFHKKLAVNRNNVVAIQSHPWTSDQLTFIKTRGNNLVNEDFEKYLPKYYHRPDGDDPSIVREQWMKAKYEREEFKNVSQQSAYNQGSKTGSLFKRGKDNDKFLRRKFVLEEPAGNLQYFIKYSDKVPKDTIQVRSLVNIYLVPEKIGNVNGMQITYEKEGTRRNLYVFGDDGKVSSDWYHTIRASMVRHKFQNFPDKDMKRYLNTKIIREGWMSKTGPKRQQKFRKRWFSLVGTMIWYYTNALDAHPLGYIPLGSKTFGYGIMKGFPQGTKVDGYGLTVHTPDRVYALNCSTLESREKWVSTITNVLDSCTTVWAQPKIGSEDANTSVDDKSSIQKSTSSVFTGLSTKFKPSDSDSSSIQDSVSENNSRVPIFQKKTNRPTTNNIAKIKKASIKRQRGSTTKVHGAQQDDGGDNTSNDDGDDRVPKIVNAGSKKYSDDSDDSSDGDITSRSDVHSISSVTEDDSDADVVILLQNSTFQTEDSHQSQSNFMENEQHTESNAEQTTIEKVKHNVVLSDDATSTQPPKKPPRHRLIHKNHSGSGSSDTGSPILDRKSSSSIPSDYKLDYEPPSTSLISSSHSNSKDDENDLMIMQDGDHQSITDIEHFRPPSVSHISDEGGDWRKKTFNSVRRVEGHERVSVRKKEPLRRLSMSSNASSMMLGDNNEVKPRPVDITLSNHMDENLWFMVFQSEVNPSEIDSYVTPWIGAQIAETPASVGPIRVPPEFEIAVIDTAPGGFGLQRTTGPFYAEPGDVWEVEIPVDDGSAPEMFYHEGMETEDGSIMIYASVSNIKKFEIALFKSGRKMISRKGVKPGDAVSMQIKKALYFLAVDQEAYYDLDGQDVRSSEYIPKASCVDISYRVSRMRVQAKKRGKSIYFTRT